MRMFERFKLPEIQPCPVCGKMPTKVKSYNMTQKKTEYEMFHEGGSCKKFPVTTMVCADSKREAIIKWNGFVMREEEE